MNATTTQVRTSLISALGLEGGDVLHLNGRTFEIVAVDVPESGRSMRAYYFSETVMDFLVLNKVDLVKVS
jgi:hypothetical protein